MAKTSGKILLVDESDNGRELLALFIKHLGYEVFQAATGLHAIDRAAKIRPDLIMMDLLLPGMNGDQAMACLKGKPSTRDIPVLVSIAGCMSDAHAKRVLDAGAAEILQKPLDLTKLPTVLHRYLSA
jgi:CheY-like chemotaxis protein